MVAPPRVCTGVCFSLCLFCTRCWNEATYRLRVPQSLTEFVVAMAPFFSILNPGAQVQTQSRGLGRRPFLELDISPACLPSLNTPFPSSGNLLLLACYPPAPEFHHQPFDRRLMLCFEATLHKSVRRDAFLGV